MVDMLVPAVCLASHILNFLRTLAEGQVMQLAEAWHRDEQRFRAWSNTVNGPTQRADIPSIMTLARKRFSGWGAYVAIARPCQSNLRSGNRFFGAKFHADEVLDINRQSRTRRSLV
jgi:hypothetical protein